MIIKYNKFIVFLVLSFFLFPSLVQSLGTLQKNNFAEIKAGDSYKFKVLFWNREVPTTPVKLIVKQAPEGWVVIVRPDEFILNQSRPESPPYQEGIEYLSLPEGIIKTKPIEVIVGVPKSAESGEYNIIITANAGSSEEGGISVLQERTLIFTVKSISSTFNKTPKEFVETTGERLGEAITGLTSLVSEEVNILLIITVIGIIWMIKRYL